ncbi:hypothetical protein BC835DRAFT_702487 [Cytidiella melzeri]|nr:hypothetical protein BC835DRAFT_702487 [Cytidiella melzeri]
MDRYRSPQSFTSAAITIGTPRPLRPHGPDESTTTTNTPATRNHALPRHTPVIPSRTPILDENRELPPDEHGVLQSLYTPEGAEMLEEDSKTETAHHEQMDRMTRTGFIGSLMSGLRRIPKAMQKHHSRQSMYEEYMAEAQAEAIRSSQMSPNMNRPLDDISESVEEDNANAIEPQRNQSSQDTYDDGTTAVHHDWSLADWPPMRSPIHTSSQPDSRHSNSESSMRPLPPEDTWAYYFARIAHFAAWLRDLPWSEERIVADFVPARDGRGGFGAERPVNAWYKPKTRKGQYDNEKGSNSISPPAVLVVPATPQSGLSPNYYSYGVAPVPPPPIASSVLRSPLSDDAVTAIRPMRTPMTATSAGLPYNSPGMSSHGMGRHELTYSWYSDSPQQWPPYLSQFSSPQTQTHTRLGTEIYLPDRR